MQAMLLARLLLLPAAASASAAKVSIRSDANAYNCTAMPDEYSAYCCVQIQLYPANPDHVPGVEVYTHAHEMLSVSQVNYGEKQAFYSDLALVVDVMASYIDSMDGAQWVDNSSVWCGDKRYGAFNTATGDLAVLVKATTIPTAAIVALNAAY